MRDLTEEELELAPEWATHYDADYFGAHKIKVCFFNEEKALNLFRNGVVGDSYFNEEGILSSDRKIPERKPFDITKHEFSDKDIRLSNLCNSKIELAVDDCGIEHYFTQNKDDAIAIAKALGATGEDLK